MQRLSSGAQLTAPDSCQQRMAIRSHSSAHVLRGCQPSHPRAGRQSRSVTSASLTKNMTPSHSTFARSATPLILRRPSQSSRDVRTQSFLVPDLSPHPDVPAAIAEATRAAAMNMPLWEASARAVAEIAIVFLAAWSINKLLEYFCDNTAKVLEARMARADEGQVGSDDEAPNFVLAVATAAVTAVEHPARTLLPLAAVTNSLRVCALLAEMFVHRNKAELQTMTGYWVSRWLKHLSNVDQFFLDCSEVVVVALTFWFLRDFSSKIVELMLEHNRKTAPKNQKSSMKLERILVPASGLLNWALVVAGALTVLSTVGINIQPLLTFGGVSGIAVGFGIQSLTQNAVSGLNMFLSRPFIVGDRVELKTMGGGTVLVGTVERIDPMRTIIRTDKAIPVQIPNKGLMDMIISNESRIEKTNVMTGFKDNRLYSTQIPVRYDDLKKVPKIAKEITEWLAKHPGVDHKMTYAAALSSLTEHSVNISITAHTTPQQSRRFTAFNSEVLLEIADVLDRNEASFAYPIG